MTWLLALILGLAHGASDASAGLLVGLILQQKTPDVNILILLYNLLAFGLQPIFGMAFDRIRQPKPGASLGLILTVLGLLTVQANLNIAIILIGLGSAGLHAGGGSVAITSTPGKASAPGVFAAFGVVGLALGGLAALHYSPWIAQALAILLASLAVIIWLMPQNSTTGWNKLEPVLGNAALRVSNVLVILLVLAVALRSTVWVDAQINVGRYSSAALWVALAAGTGKLMGGFASDRIGWDRWMLTAMGSSAVLLAFTSNEIIPATGWAWLPGLLLGVFFLQSMTPLSIAAAGKALPHSPALAASLTLGTAIITGGLPFFFFVPLPGMSHGWVRTALLALVLLASGSLYWVFLNKTRSINRA